MQPVTPGLVLVAFPVEPQATQRIHVQGDVLVPRIGHRASWAALDRPLMAEVDAAKTAMDDEAALQQRQSWTGRQHGQGRQVGGPPCDSLGLLKGSAARGSIVRKRKTLSKPIAEGGTPSR